jgi:F-type H+-transporting ATPase subunit delta
VYHVNRWADAFIKATEKNTEEAFSCLKALALPVKSAHKILFGCNAAGQIEKLLRESAGPQGRPTGRPTGTAGTDPAVEYTIRFITLLVEKNCFRHIDSVLQKIEQRMNEQMGILDVIAESAAPMDSVFAEEMRRLIMERTGAAGVKMKTKLAPELLGGYCLRIGGFFIDASLKGQVEQMKADLTAAAMTAMRGGGNGEL